MTKAVVFICSSNLGVAGGAASTVFDAIDGAKDGWDRRATWIFR